MFVARLMEFSSRKEYIKVVEKEDQKGVVGLSLSFLFTMAFYENVENTV